MKIVYIFLILALVIVAIIMAKDKSLPNPAGSDVKPLPFLENPELAKSLHKQREVDTQISIVKKFKANEKHDYLIVQFITGGVGNVVTRNWLYRLNNAGEVESVALPQIDSLEGAQVKDLAYDESLGLVIPLIAKRRAFLVTVDAALKEKKVIPVKSNQDVMGIAVKDGKAFVFEASDNGANMFVHETLSNLSDQVENPTAIEALYEIYDIEVLDKIHLVGGFLRGTDLETRLVAFDQGHSEKLSSTYIEETETYSLYELFRSNEKERISLVAFTRARNNYRLFDINITEQSIHNRKKFDGGLTWFDILQTKAGQLFALEIVKKNKSYSLKLRNMKTAEAAAIGINDADVMRFYRQISALDSERVGPVAALAYAELAERMTYDVLEIAQLTSASE